MTGVAAFAKFGDTSAELGVPAYEPRVTRIMGPDDTQHLFAGTFEVTDNQRYMFRAAELRWLSEQIRRGGDTRPDIAASYAIERLRHPAAVRYWTPPAADSFDFALSFPRLEVREPPAVRIVVRPADVVPNFSAFRMKKPVAITVLDLVTLGVLAVFSSWALGGYAAVSIVLSFLAVREGCNMILRSLIRHERVRRYQRWLQYPTFLDESV